MGHPLLAAARRRPSMTFALAGGAFALWYVLADPVVALLTGGDPAVPSGPMVVLVAGGFLGGGLLASLLWRRLGGANSRVRGALVGGLVGLLALPVPMYLLELAVVVMEGSPFEASAGAGPVSALVETVILFLVVPLLLGALGVIATLGGTVVVGAATGLVLAWE
ncbi:hypothetical protein C5B91_08600 [Haloferax sp. Atlit-10N]|uniref:Uncharacterized protein n=1 Tax=Haloferax prahovense (strain DSM 18310 / JCM 13924 / TL6) TaxID=1227461 RepID=M0G2B8_HALPT|nr:MULTISPECIES: hypothetical protein [Haloferax]ELZ65687.1 hypothetical protein C457_16147 [Haloferax prahovense DSM 18310]RDZ44951.1 hypothetical protein C5B87_12370 [Haloferax sp. Atlit-16N]RDZ48303.1 hypothetical protein C5B86_04435 [Haloferax sp. Atlit-19N]RDZ59272.1 hypothetical protein C5B91_08600 [Haloferax sp. Atlit-10N]